MPRAAISAKGGESPLIKFSSLSRMMRAAYPEYPWEDTKFADLRRVREGLYKNGQNSRLFFDEYASEKGFDPLVVENWYFNLKDLLKKKVPTTGGKTR